MAVRTDKFRPSVIDPTKFTFIGHHYIGGMSDDTWAALCDEINEGAEALEAHQAAHPGFTMANHKWEGQCDCCGARYKFGAWFHDAESNTYISIGGICASKLSLGSPEAMKTFREQVNTFKVHQERIAKARAYLTSVNLVAMLDMYLDKNCNSREFPEVTLRDMCSKVVQWGNELSEKQQSFARKLLQQIADRPRLEAERAERDANRQPVPVSDKRLTISGVILSTREQEAGWTDSGFFQPECTKVLVEHADGWKVWGTMPRGAGWKKGDKVQFDARVQRSEKDSTFGFFSRPTKAEVLDKCPV